MPFLLSASALNTIFCVYTFFGSVFILYLNELGLDKTRIGFLVSLVPFCGIISIFVVDRIARLGFKRTFLIFYISRKFTVALLLLAPFAISRWGLNSGFFWVAVVIFLFAIMRAVAFSALNPWQQEMIPPESRGKYDGLSGVCRTVASIAVTAFAGYLIGRLPGLKPFLILIGIGVVCGVLSGVLYSFVPGGEPVGRAPGSTARGDLQVPVRDRNFLVFIAGIMLVSLSFSAFNAFVPLFMREHIGFAADRVVYLGIGSSLAALIFYYPWGWAADRYGSRPVMITGLGFMLLLPVGWLLLPLAGQTAYNWALAISFLLGFSHTGWFIGYNRYLYVSAVPPAFKAAYLAIFMTMTGLTDGAGPLLSGVIVDSFQRTAAPVHFLFGNPYMPVFLAGLALMGGTIFLVTRVRNDGGLPTRKFLGMFIQGNPLMAFESLVRFSFDRDEYDRVSTTERIGRARNPLTVTELAEALQDPSFNVRHEALISASRMPAEPELIDELLTALSSRDIDLACGAAWALGRIGDPITVLPLREMLFSAPPMLRARCARALGMIGDRGAVPMLRKILREETEPAQQVACASALGILRAQEATEDILAAYETVEGDMFRQEITLALVRIAGDEGFYVRMLRRFHRDRISTLLQFLYLASRRFKNGNTADDRKNELEEIIQLLSDDKKHEGAIAFGQFIAKLKLTRNSPAEKTLDACARLLLRDGAARLESALMGIHLLLLELRRQPTGIHSENLFREAGQPENEIRHAR